jgi:diguanylate cyclase (GGDEF)-like protein
MHALRQREQLSRSMSRYLAFGFALLIVLMAALVGHAIWHIHDLKSRMGDIVDMRNRKIQLATDLQEASYNRHNTLVYQVLSQDAFERDENFQLYIKWGYLVGNARNKLKALPLDAFERTNLARQDQLVAEIILLQEEISDLAARGEEPQARTRLASDLRPLNRQYTEVVALRRHERDLIRDALEQARQATFRAISLHLGLGAALVLLAVAIAAITQHLMKRAARIIYAQVAELEQAGSLLEHQATHDPLTGLANRTLFYRRLEEAIRHAGEENFSLAVMYIDLDDFKQINDEHGHAAGDALLLAVARRFHQVLRKSDSTGRLGGDEFALLFVGIEAASCAELHSKIKHEICQPVYHEGLSLLPSCSIGCAMYPQDGKAIDDLLNTADARMYAAKRARKQAAGGNA